jgi:hypothetical protein
MWIPELKICYRRSHFNFNKIPGIKTNRKACGCPNTEVGEKSDKCRICNYIDKLWEKWRNTSDAKQKKKIQNKINSLIDERFYLNAIDLDDEDKKFQAIRLTQAKLEELMTVAEDHDIANIVWLYKKVVKKVRGGLEQTRYTLTELIDDPDALALKEQLDELKDRSYDEGGLVDLEKSYGFNMSVEEFDRMLTTNNKQSNHDDDKVDEDVDMLGDSDEEENNEESVEEDDDNMSLDDLDDDSLDDLDDDDDDNKVTMKPITAKFVNENRKKIDMMNVIIEYFAEKELIKTTDEYKKDLKTLYAYVKKHKVEIPENLMEEL